MKVDTQPQEISRFKVVLTNISTISLKSFFVSGIVIRYALLLVIFIVTVGYGLKFLNNPESYSLARPILFYDSKLFECAMLVVPEAYANFKGIDIARIFLIVIAFFLRIFVGTISWSALSYAEYFTLKETIGEMHLSGYMGDTPDLDEKLESLKLGGQGVGKSRDELLKIMSQVQRNLDSMKRNLAFLAIDVVDSTGMKEGEDSTKIEMDFMEYKNLVEKSFSESGYLKASWTPDGVMSCFKTSNAAVKAARQVLTDLKTFNRERKTIKREFAVRCGVNAGKVAYDEKMPMEQMSDHVIDIAGHFQKYAPPGTICISKVVYEDLFDPERFKHSDKKIDGLDSYTYKG